MTKQFVYDLDKMQHRTLDTVLFITYVFYISIALGVYFISPQYINLLHNIVKLYICFFLIYRFNPWRTVNCTYLDRRVAFTAGFFLLSTTIFENILHYFLSKTETHVKKIARKFDSKQYTKNSNTANTTMNMT